MGSAMTWPGTQGHKCVSSEILIENTERVREGGRCKKKNCKNEREGGHNEPEMHGEHEEKREIRTRWRP